MERNFNNGEFERFLRDSADHYKMYPAEKVWKGIYKSIHTRRRWFGLGALFFLAAGISTFLYLSPDQNTSTQLVAQDQPAATKQQEPGTPETGNTLLVDQGTAGIIPTAASDPGTVPVRSVATRTIRETDLRVQPEEQQTPLTGSDITPVESVTLQSLAPAPASYPESWHPGAAPSPGLRISGRQQVTEVTDLTPAVFPWTIDNALTTSLRSPRKDRFSLQLYFTPTVSYRKLADNKSYLRTSQFVGAYNYLTLNNINQAVTHRPDLGLELGVAGRYAVGNNIKIRAGVQFNVSRYGIKAFNNPYEIATIALNNGRGVDSLSTITRYRNISGMRTNWLENLYFQVSAPVGVELTLGGNDEVRYGVAGTIQPTYVLGDRAYLLSSDYKNYAKIPWLIRRWNANTSFEAFVGYSTGRLNWQVGPQVRYQILSSFVEKYPVRENLFDFGLKVGVTVQK